MAQEQPPATTGLKIRRFKTDTVFLLLKDGLRRQIIRRLAIGGMKTGVDLNAASGKKRHAYLKDIVALRDAGIIVQLENPKHERRPLYALGPNVIVCKEEKFITADLGCYVMRFAR